MALLPLIHRKCQIMLGSFLLGVAFFNMLGLSSIHGLCIHRVYTNS